MLAFAYQLIPKIGASIMSVIPSGPLSESIELNDNETLSIQESVIAPIGTPAIDIPGDNVNLSTTDAGSIAAPDDGNTAILSSGDGVQISNFGSISGAFNGISSTGDGLNLTNFGLISSDSRAVDNSDGDGIRAQNFGTILGTGDQRNGTFYIDGTVDDLSLQNFQTGVIDAGEGNLGDAVSVQVGAEGDASNDDINITNAGLLQGRGDGPDVFADGARVAANGSSGLRFFNGSGLPEATVSGSITNSGTITAEVNVGFLGGVVVEDGVAFDGTIVNEQNGLISGPRNGLYIGNAEHDLAITNRGRIESGSRAVNIDGDNVSFENAGTIEGIGDQRNGTFYLDGTADEITVNNTSTGVIDAGVGNSGSGVSIQVGAAGGLSDGADDVETSADVVNSGLIQGRGDANVPAGVRLFVGSGLEESTFTGTITNQSNGVIASDSDAGILIESGIIFDGQIVNAGLIQGGNGLAINAEGASGGIYVGNTGTLDGDVVLGSDGDVFNSANGLVNGIVSGLGGDDLLIGGREEDVLAGGFGSDTLTGGQGADSFVFSPAELGADVITDFEDGTDLLDVSAFSFGVSALQSVIDGAQQIGSDALLTFSPDNSVLLQGVQTGVVDTTDFIA